MPYVKTLLSVSDIVSVTAPPVGYSRNSVPKFFTKHCQARISLVQISTVMYITYECKFISTHNVHTSHLIWVKFGTKDVHVTRFSKC
jgi:hypothetical protein